MSRTPKILIAYDGSDCASAAIADLRHAGLGSKVQARVITVADPWIPPIESMAIATDVVFAGAFMVAREQTRNAHKDAKALAEKGAAVLRKEFPEWTVTAAAVTDTPAHGIINAAEKWKPSLIVLGSQGHTALGALLLGSVSHRVLTHAPCNVRIVRKASARTVTPPRILLAVDGSKDADAMVRCVVERSWGKDAEFCVIAVLDYRLSLVQDFESAPVAKNGSHRAAFRTSLPERLMERAVKALTERGLKVSSVVREGDPRTEIAKEVKRFKATGLFVGCRGLHAVQRFFLGSVSLSLAERAGCSVEVVR